SWYGPVPSSCVANQFFAHGSLLVLLSLTAFGLTIGSFGSLPRRYASGCFSVICSFDADGAAIAAMFAVSVAGPWFTPLIRSRPSFTAAASSAVPSWNLTPERIVNV